MYEVLQIMLNDGSLYRSTIADCGRLWYTSLLLMELLYFLFPSEQA